MIILRSGFTRGVVIGSLIGASVSMLMNNDMMSGRNRRRLIKNGRNMLRRSGSIVGDMVDLFR